ncbi:iron chelate uptake ABC transporter family permease subunit [Leucobacter allii]|uniref:FecCD family ABC transporter permease n=1 Tax=Leucobacter allii TaxID=2932247 RepID=UPI001FD40C28|nr:iron chelate uptake ABC transporter family permease subunit [Leucobacter allii]UOR02438.1 iron chelate uptake ABC transporter family permease subunit [Leucobacter allii]
MRAAPSPTRRGWGWVAAGALVLGVLVASLIAGDLVLSPADVWAAVTGRADAFTTTVVMSWRLPRALAALAFGAALGAAGAVFQSVTRNPLGSPDVIGFNTGAYTGVLIVLLTAPAAGFGLLAGASLVGGLATAALVLAFSRGAGLGERTFILTGIAVGALLGSINTWLVYRTDTATATAGSVWAAGTLDNTRWQNLTPALLGLAVAAIVLMAVAPRLRILALGDDVATTLGLRVRKSRTLLITAAVALTAITTASAGPILFIALAAPHLARATLSRRHPVIAAALAGALLLGMADWLAAHAFAPAQLPVGAVTISIGGAYLVLTMLQRPRH